jgi:hypothetical protein
MAKMSALATEKEKQRMQFMISNKGVGVGIDSTTGETVTFMDLWQRKTKEDGFADYMQEKYPINWDNSEFVSPRKLSIQNAAAKRAEAELRRQQSREAVPPTLRGGLM